MSRHERGAAARAQPALDSNRGLEAAIDVSVVVPFYNAERSIEDCIAALRAQTLAPPCYEIIMVDNNSTDGSVDLVRKYPDVRLLSEKKQGSYAARNRGVAAARGAIVAFTDADCVPSREWLENIRAAMASPSVQLIQGGRWFAVDSPALSMVRAYESERAAYVFSSGASKLGFGYTNNMAMRRDLWDRRGPFLEIDRGADSLFVIGVMEEGSSQPVRYVEHARIRHNEITCIQQWLRKKFIYGQSFQRNYAMRQGRHRALTRQEIQRILGATVRRNEYSVPQAIGLAGLVGMGMLAFQFGRLSVRLGQAR
jgi:glycosyltransferase involved in cell wall biosynthesis